jgi:general secretion pathway protein D
MNGVAAVIRGALFVLVLLSPMGLWAQDTTAVRVVDDTVSIRFIDVDIRAVIQALGRYLPKPIVVDNVSPARVTIETPRPIPVRDVAALLRGLVESRDLVFQEDSVFFRIAPRDTRRPREGPGDSLAAQEPLRLSVVRLKHARAADVAATVNLLFGGSGQFTGGEGFTTGTLSEELTRTAARTLEPPGEPGSTQQETAELMGSVTIVPDELTNSLFVRATERDAEVINQAVQQLDVRPLQVLVQVLIVEVRRDRVFSLGAEASVDSADLGGGALLSALLFSAGSLGDLVVKVMSLSKYDIDVTLHAAMSRGDARIVSRPVVVASNNREARILVGSQQPFVQVSRSLPTESPTRDQVVQYRDVGTKLSVLPTINEDGYVSLLIRQEVSTATSEVQFDAPVIATREAETTVLVRDGQTVVMGGLREQLRQVTKSGVPILSSIPVVGGLFGFEDRHTVETELFLFITPTVLTDDESTAEAAQRALEDAEKAGVPIPPAGIRLP